MHILNSSKNTLIQNDTQIQIDNTEKTSNEKDHKALIKNTNTNEKEQKLIAHWK